MVYGDQQQQQQQQRPPQGSDNFHRDLLQSHITKLLQRTSLLVIITSRLMGTVLLPKELESLFREELLIIRALLYDICRLVCGSGTQGMGLHCNPHQQQQLICCQLLLMQITHLQASLQSLSMHLQIKTNVQLIKSCGLLQGDISSQAYNGQSFKFERILQAHDQAIRSMGWSHDENWMVSGDDGGSIKYWQTNMNNVKANKSAHKESVCDLSLVVQIQLACGCSEQILFFLLISLTLQHHMAQHLSSCLFIICTYSSFRLQLHHEMTISKEKKD
ncbi:uncharacterized protein LOC122081162 isoform X1 [Macadamia integrifolia]|uniref:uncharacterized protein LOC122081162 isoform X1 n=1 Tax=Macadamia integrifolia TaxID=60698 RepID=UPI001C4FBC30|nr:uncharacterized protein LOC122081162 isoform X1 [Macadamia integrifolia]XP_042504091.1 uncharacterized protein LOC122081162 isoform X2 [Macadamia integrifolia]XP_042504092.1 uncharacterized protein LOC122081162 isoform X1 [Macadamia integrifolia]